MTEDYSNHHQYFNSIALAAIIIVLIFTILIGTCGNILVLCVYTYRNDSKTSTFFIKILAYVDLIICTLLAPLELYQTTKGIYNEFVCKIYAFLNTHVLYSTFLMTTIAFDRYFSICWPLYKIITINRARLVVSLGGLVSSLLAVIPMSEYSTIDHTLKIHKNHSEQLTIDISDEYNWPIYTDVRTIKASALTLPFTIVNITKVKCSPRFSLHLNLSSFLSLYRLFHVTLFLVCILLVIILYSLIYNAVCYRRQVRTRKLSRYRKVLGSYLANDQRECPHVEADFPLALIYCSSFNRPNTTASNELTADDISSNRDEMELAHKKEAAHFRRKLGKSTFQEPSICQLRRFSLSMISIAHTTGALFEDASSVNFVDAMLPSTRAVKYCGVGHSAIHQASTLMEDPCNKTNRCLTIENKSSRAKSVGSTSSALPVSFIEVSISSKEEIKRRTSIDIHSGDRSFEWNNLLHPSSYKTAADRLLNQRQYSATNVPRMNSASKNIRGSTRPSLNQQADFNVNNNDLLSSSMDKKTGSTCMIDASKTYTLSFDIETRRLLERQEKQERLANIRTTLTLFVITTTFIAMYMPPIIMTLFDVKQNEFRQVLFLLYYMNSACNPLIYSLFNGNFRNDLRRIYRWSKRIHH